MTGVGRCWSVLVGLNQRSVGPTERRGLTGFLRGRTAQEYILRLVLNAGRRLTLMRIPVDATF